MAASLRAGVLSGSQVGRLSTGLTSSLAGKRLSFQSSVRLPLRTRKLHGVRAVAEDNKVKEELQKIASEASKTFQKITEDASHALEDAAHAIEDKVKLPTPDELQVLQVQTQQAAAEVKHKAEVLAEQLKVQAEKAKVQIKEQADKASHQIEEVLHHVEENKEQIAAVAKDAPEPIREIVETAISSHSRDAIRRGAVIHDFCLGIPYGALLVVGGVLWFTLAGSLNALRFGLILGGCILASSISSLHAWQNHRPSSVYIAVQGALTSLVFVNEASRFAMTKALFPTGLAAVASILMVAFYTYIYMSGGNRPKAQASNLS
ncbi:hypothetical protein CLOM_g16468 [Closterium sp. NIES-68]|nr:hypothetical protein CLOM_g16468 [Closterium sp. NIES-68]GJP58205.1 hypothetical protein CLOP_g22676 [Closterium sp. NIES-67]